MFDNILQSNSTLENLIEQVREYPCLYNRADENYKVINLKSDIWAQIAESCNFSNGENKIITYYIYNFLVDKYST